MEEYNEKQKIEQKIDDLLDVLDNECWIEDGVSDLVVGWIEPELAKIDSSLDYGEMVGGNVYDELALHIGYLCKGAIKSLLLELKRKVMNEVK